MTKLSLAFLDFNQFSGSIPTEIGLLTEMTSLHVDTNSFTGTVPTEVGMLTKVARFDWKNCQFNGTLPTELGLLTSLTNIELGGNEISGTIPTSLRGMWGMLTKLGLLDNQLSGHVPPEMFESLRRICMFCDICLRWVQMLDLTFVLRLCHSPTVYEWERLDRADTYNSRSDDNPDALRCKRQPI
mmetsp:Transcript_2694/g.6042  ORF Transcript_2694/g.6042 Transcript_2694/m.6042 type:complete len:185 (+) Transcript_2694:2175-2729(+)